MLRQRLEEAIEKAGDSDKIEFYKDDAKLLLEVCDQYEMLKDVPKQAKYIIKMLFNRCMDLTKGEHCVSCEFRKTCEKTRDYDKEI